MAWPLRLCAGHFWGLSWVWGALLDVGGSPGHGWLSPSAFQWCRRLFWAWGALLDMCRALLGTGVSPGLGGFPGHSWGSLLATLARSAGANSVNIGKGWIIFSLCYPAVGQGWGGTDISKLGLPSGNSFYLTNKEVLGALQPRWSWIGSCASVKFCCYKTKLN